MIGLDEIEALRHTEYASDEVVMEMLNTLELVWSEFEAARTVVKEQASNPGLWFLAKTAPEGYLQQELRRLHAVIEDLF